MTAQLVDTECRKNGKQEALEAKDNKDKYQSENHQANHLCMNEVSELGMAVRTEGRARKREVSAISLTKCSWSLKWDQPLPLWSSHTSPVALTRR